MKRTPVVLTATLPYWDWLKFEGERSGRTPNTVKVALARNGWRDVRVTGGKYHQRVHVKMEWPVLAKYLERRIMSKFRECDCGQVAVMRSSDKSWVCLDCYDKERQRVAREKARVLDIGSEPVTELD